MPRFSANLGFLWQELPLVERIFAAHDAGFEAVECHFPFEVDPETVLAALLQTKLPMLALNTHPGEAADGEFGLCALPGAEHKARKAIDEAITYASKIGAQQVHVMAGLSGDSADAMNCFMNNLIYASRLANKHRVGILIEPINRSDKPGYMLHLTSQAIQLIEVLFKKHKLSNIGLMFDCYHVQMEEGNLLAKLTTALPYISHIQVASVPGRAEPDNGEICYPQVFAKIDALGYRGYIGAEYIPATTTESGLGWFSDYRHTVSKG